MTTWAWLTLWLPLGGLGACAVVVVVRTVRALHRVIGPGPARYSPWQPIWPWPGRAICLLSRHKWVDRDSELIRCWRCGFKPFERHPRPGEKPR